LAQNSVAEQRIAEPIIVNGQHAQGVLVIDNGTVRTFTCPSPEPYATENKTETGWACFDQSTGAWLLRARPPAQAPVPASQPTVIYTQPAPVYVVPPTYTYYPYYSYPYSYYPFSYSYFAGPRFGFNFGFGYPSPVIVDRPFVVGRPGIIARPIGPFGYGVFVYGHRR